MPGKLLVGLRSKNEMGSSFYLGAIFSDTSGLEPDSNVFRSNKKADLKK